MKGKRIVVTRAHHQAEELNTLLQQKGAEVLAYPCIEIVPPEDCTQLDAALRAVANQQFTWLVLTSANTVRIISQRLTVLNISFQQLQHVSLAAVGPGTAAAVRTILHLEVRIIPEIYVAESLIDALAPFLPASILILQADIARPILIQELSNAGARVTSIYAYRTVQGQGGIHLATSLAQNQVDAVTFTSASTVKYCVKRLQAEHSDIQILRNVCLACIGPVTTLAAQDLGLTVTVVPEQHTIEGLVEALSCYFLKETES